MSFTPGVKYSSLNGDCLSRWQKGVAQRLSVTQIGMTVLKELQSYWDNIRKKQDLGHMTSFCLSIWFSSETVVSDCEGK